MNIYVISLIERKDRMKLFLQQSTEQNIDYKLIEAIDGRELDTDLWIEKYDNRLLKKGEIGCYMSHYEIYEKEYDLGINDFIIFEDDCRVVDKYWDRVEEVKNNTPDDWDIIMLGTTHVFKNKYIKNCKVLYENNFVLKIQGDIYGAHNYIVKRKAVATLIQTKFPINVPIDIKINNLGLNVYITKKQISTQRRMGNQTHFLKNYTTID